jgi:hypothetical protein
VSDGPVVLDEHRGMMAQKATEVRRHLAAFEAEQAALRGRQAELEKHLLAAPAASWEDAAEKARYLLALLAATSEGQDPRRRKIIAGVLDDFARLAAGQAEPTGEGRRADAADTNTAAAEHVGQQRHRTEEGRTPKGGSETAAEKDERLRGVENDRRASRKATEGSRGKRRRGGGLGVEGSS